MSNRGNGPWGQQRGWPWRGGHRGWGRDDRRNERDGRNQYNSRQWRGKPGERYRNPSPPRPKPPPPPLPPRRDDSSDEEVRAEKQRTTSLVKNKLQSLTAEDKSNSMKQLLEDPSRQEISNSGSKDTADSKSGEKEARRIAHVPKPIKPVPPPPPPPRLLALHLDTEEDEPEDPGQKAVQKSIKRKLLQDLLVMPISDLKVMVTCPKAQDNLFLSHLMKKTRVSLSDAMRKLAEHKLQIGKGENPQMLTELENLVDPDIAVDVCRMPLETIQALRDIFNLNLDGDLDLVPEVPVSTAVPDEPLEPENAKELYDPMFPTSEDPDKSPFQWHTPTPFRTNDSFLPSIETLNSGYNVVIPEARPALFAAYLDPPPPPSPVIENPESKFTPAANLNSASNIERRQEVERPLTEDTPVVNSPDVSAVLEGIQNVVKKLEEAKNARVNMLKLRENSSHSYDSLNSQPASTATLPSSSPVNPLRTLLPEKLQGKIIRDTPDVNQVEKKVDLAPLPLSEKIRNMKEIREKREFERHIKEKKHRHKIKIKLASMTTQTDRPALRNNFSQYPLTKVFSVLCQTSTTSFANSSVQTVPLFHGLVSTSSQTEPCRERELVSTAPFSSQTDPFPTVGDGSSQTDFVATAEKETQHTVLYSNRGEQVNRSFLTSNKYAQTSIKSVSALKSDKKEDSGKESNNGKSADKGDKKEKQMKQKPTSVSKVVKEREKSPPVEEEDSLEGVEGNALVAEFQSFRQDVRALDTANASPLRRRLVSHMIGLMSSTFQNFYKLFSEIQPSRKPIVSNTKRPKSGKDEPHGRDKTFGKSKKLIKKRKRSRSPSNDSSMDRNISKNKVRKRQRSRSRSSESNRERGLGASKGKIGQLLKKPRKSPEAGKVPADNAVQEKIPTSIDRKVQDFSGKGTIVSPVEMARKDEVTLANQDTVKKDVGQQGILKKENEKQETVKKDTDNPGLPKKKSETSKKNEKLKATENKKQMRPDEKKTKNKKGEQGKFKRLSLKEMFTDSDESSSSDHNEKRGKWQMLSDSDDDGPDSGIKIKTEPDSDQDQCILKVIKDDPDGKMDIKDEPVAEPPTYEWYKRQFNLRECSVNCSMPAKSSAPPTPTYESPVHESSVPSITSVTSLFARRAPHITSSSSSDDDSQSSGKPPTPTPWEHTPKVIEDSSLESPRSPWTSDGQAQAGANSVTTVSDNTLHDPGEDCIDGKKMVTIVPIEFLGHNGSVSDFKISGNHLLAASADTVHCYSLKNGKRKRKYTGHTPPILCLSMLQKKGGEVLFTADQDQILRAFSVQDSSLLGTSKPLGGVPLCMDTKGESIGKGSLFVGLDSGEALSVNPKTLKVIRRLRIGETPVVSVAAAEVGDSRVLITSSADCQLSLRDVTIGDLQQRLDWNYSVPAEKMLYCEGSLFCCSKLPHLVIFSFSSDAGWSEPIEVKTSPDAMALSLADQYLFVGSRSGNISVIDIKSQKLETEFCIEGGLTSVAIHKKVAVASYDGGKLIAWPLPQRVRKFRQ